MPDNKNINSGGEMPAEFTPFNPVFPLFNN